jgi:DNA-binding protein
MDCLDIIVMAQGEHICHAVSIVQSFTGAFRGAMGSVV